MDRLEKKELSQQIVKKVDELNEVASQVEKEGLKIRYNFELIEKFKPNHLLHTKIIEVIDYGDNYEREERPVGMDKTQLASHFIKIINKKVGELNSLVLHAHREGVKVDYLDNRPLGVYITETIIYSD